MNGDAIQYLEITLIKKEGQNNKHSILQTVAVIRKLDLIESL